MLAVIPVRDGELPAGALETIAECGGRVVLVGDRLDVVDVVGATDVRTVELGPFAPGSWAASLDALLADEPIVVLPASPDGRDLAPRLAHVLRRPLVAGAVSVAPERITVPRRGGLELHVLAVRPPIVATLQPGVRGVDPAPPVPDRHGTRRAVVLERRDVPDATVVAVHPPDVTTIDLTEADRIAAGGAGLDSAARFDQLSRIAAAIGGAMGATRVVTDRAWVGHERQIGTTGVVVSPELYLSFGISGAVQHTSGLGDPRHVISVNVDPHCPMMQMSDLAVVSDANSVLDELELLLGTTIR
ncbi:MAG TPA: mycofactocin-associated electron transfer flavoprotein alpha subunit [Ilumatobacteraceae bacterium]|nr:mycofactocin-associated electron transfer flavoprotein alpha subunit [Ilumatobacteraceae bacterium]